MLIEYKSKQLRAICLNQNKAEAKYGRQQAQKIQQRINEILAVPTLNDLNRLPPTRCHLLKQNRKGQIAVNLHKQKRLIFEPLGVKKEIYNDDVLDMLKVVKVRILEISDHYE